MNQQHNSKACTIRLMNNTQSLLLLLQSTKDTPSSRTKPALDQHQRLQTEFYNGSQHSILF